MTSSTDTTIRATLLFLAGIALVALLYVTRELLAPFALAIFIWLIIDAFARWMDNLSPKFPYWLALSIAVLTVVGLMVGFIFVIVDTVGDVVRDAGTFAATIQSVLSEFFLIALYVVFLFAAQSSFPKKMDDLFPNEGRRLQAAKVGERIRYSIEKCLDWIMPCFGPL